MIAGLIHYLGLCPCNITHPDLLDLIFAFPFLFLGIKAYFETWTKR